MFPVMSSLSPQAAALLDLPVNACRWPIGDHGWCGEPATHNAYCGNHYRDSRAKDQRGPSQQTVNRWLTDINIRSKRGRQAA